MGVARRRAARGLLPAIVLAGVLVTATVLAQQVEVPAPGPTDTCAVCGMFVSKYPDWVASVEYRDGHVQYFDGAKDMFKALFDLPRYAPGHSRESIAAIAVTEYYGLTRVDARGAWYVIGSDVLGPMGHELVPLASAADAQEFLVDHRGTAVLRFTDVTPQVLQRLDGGAVPGR